MHRVNHKLGEFLKDTSPGTLHTAAPLWTGRPSDLMWSARPENTFGMGIFFPSQSEIFSRFSS